MKRLAKLVLSLFLVTATVLSLVGCGGSMVALPYSDTIEPYDNFYDITEYNKELFYRNDMEIDAPDLHVIRINDGGEYDGQFFMYATGSNAMSVIGFDTYSSVDGVTWKSEGAVLVPDDKDWAYERYWAPEVVYDPNADRADYRSMLGDDASGKGVYYMFFSAINRYDGLYYWDETHPLYKEGAIAPNFRSGSLYRQTYYIGLAVSASPAGPFQYYTNSKWRLKSNPLKSYTDEVSEWLGYGIPSDDNPLYERNPWYDETKREKRSDEAFIDHYDMIEDGIKNGVVSPQHPSFFCMIDVSPFVDPATGNKYLYFKREAHGKKVSCIAGMQLTGADGKWSDDPMTETVTQLTSTGYKTLEETPDNATDLMEGNCNEGPFTIYNENNGKYYLSLSVNNYNEKIYSVVQAIGDSPLGPFRKLMSEEGGWVIMTEGHWDWVGGTGHHSFVKVDGEWYIFYHSHRDRINGGGNRGANVSKLEFVKNNDGLEVLYSVPTFSLQPRFGSTAKYKNIAFDAEVKAKNLKNGSSESYLNDKLLTVYSYNTFVKETEFKKGKSTVTFTFDDYRTVRAIMVYQSKKLATGFENVDRIEFDYEKEINGKLQSGTAYIDNLAFDHDRYRVESDYNEEESYFRGVPAAIAEFDELRVKEIRVTIDEDYPVNVSEIVILGL